MRSAALLAMSLTALLAAIWLAFHNASSSP
jgi:hypothetical protein